MSQSNNRHYLWLLFYVAIMKINYKSFSENYPLATYVWISIRMMQILKIDL